MIVALDLETTGLNKDEDDIIEIGAARFEGGELLETYGTLVDPGRAIPDRITAITGITTEDLIGAPSIRQALPELRRFIGNSPIIGHRVDFDLGFLNRYGVGTHNLAIDTYDLASVLLPTAPRYNLTHLTSEFGLELEHAHRALDDAVATGRLYWSLWGASSRCRWARCKRSSRPPATWIGRRMPSSRPHSGSGRAPRLPPPHGAGCARTRRPSVTCSRRTVPTGRACARSRSRSCSTPTRWRR